MIERARWYKVRERISDKKGEVCLEKFANVRMNVNNLINYDFFRLRGEGELLEVYIQNEE